MALWFGAITVFVVPPGVYIWKFRRAGLSDDPNHWGALGSYLSGVYAPLLALLTFWVLLRQIRLQGEMNRFIVNQADIAMCREGFLTALEDVARLMEQRVLVVGLEGFVRFHLLRHFGHSQQPTVELLRALEGPAKHMLVACPTLAIAWGELTGHLERLACRTDDPQFRRMHSSLVERAASRIGMRECMALDLYHWVDQDGRSNVKDYAFMTQPRESC